jgi:hypothetical protein
MRIRKLVAILAIAGLGFWTPSIMPVKASMIDRLRPRRLYDGRHGFREAARFRSLPDATRALAMAGRRNHRRRGQRHPERDHRLEHAVP